MDTWYSVSLGDGIMAPTPSAEIEVMFLQAFNVAGPRPDMAIFTRPESEGRLHCEVMAYFSPAAKDIAQTFDAEPCEKPSPVGLALLAGDGLSWSALFPERD